MKSPTSEVSEYEQQAIDFLSKHRIRLEWSFERFGKYFEKDEQPRNIFTWRLIRNHGAEDTVISGSFGSSIMDSCKKSPALYSPFDCEIYWGVKIGEDDAAMFLSHRIKTDYPTILKYSKNETPLGDLINWTVLKKDYADFIERRVKLAKKFGMLPNLPQHLKSVAEVGNLIEHRLNRFITEAKTKMVLYDQADTIVTPSAYDLLASITKNDPDTFENFCSDFGYDTDSRSAERTYNSVKKQWEDVYKFFSDEEITELQEIN